MRSGHLRRRQGQRLDAVPPSPTSIGAQIRSSVQALEQLAELGEIAPVLSSPEAASKAEG